MNNKTTLFTLAFLLCLTLVTATTIYGGQTIILELEEPYAYWSIIGNSTPVDLNVTQDGNIVTIIAGKYMNEDSFELSFLNPEKETITIYRGGGGGGGSSGRIRTIYENVTEYVNVTDAGSNTNTPTETPGIIEAEEESGLTVLIISVLILIIIILSIAYAKKSKIKVDTFERGEEYNEQ